MNLFWQEYLHFIVSVFAILVCLSSGWLFLLTYEYEKKLHTVWRSVGFFSLAIAFFLLILERKFQSLGLVAVVFEVIGFFSIYLGVFAEPKLSQLIETSEGKSKKEITSRKKNALLKRLRSDLLTLGLLVVGVLVIINVFPLLKGYLFTGLEIVAAIFIVATIVLQRKRYLGERKGKLVKKQNLYPLVGFTFLLLRGVSLALYRLPELDLVALRNLTLDFGTTWQFSVLFTFLGFLFLAIWTWNFVKVRTVLRTYIVVLIVAIIVSTLGSLIFANFVFQTVESNNLHLMTQGANTQNLMLQDRSDKALFTAKMMASNSSLVDKIYNDYYTAARKEAEIYLENSGADILRIYGPKGRILISPSDTRDEGRAIDNDALLTQALNEKKVMQALDTQPGVLADILVARAIYPIVSNEKIIAAIEIGYKFDTAFVDYFQRETGLDATIYANAKRSATTIKTLDGVSRWVGSEETNPKVIEKVLGQGKSYSTATDRLGQKYYSAFKPVKNSQGEVVSMVSVGTPTHSLIEDTRQKLIDTLLIVTIISLLVALLGDSTIRNLNKRED